GQPVRRSGGAVPHRPGLALAADGRARGRAGRAWRRALPGRPPGAGAHPGPRSPGRDRRRSEHPHLLHQRPTHADPCAQRLRGRDEPPDASGTLTGVEFLRLRIAGFKSFVDPVEFHIEPGLTGIVGPNGCGKSNVLESLRWVMGANSAKAMRGQGMDDVIFAGASGRPSRNHAEVQLTIDNAQRRAPQPLTEAPLLEVSRRIDRGQGSTYKVNGKEVRARDVQLLFADAS